MELEPFLAGEAVDIEKYGDALVVYLYYAGCSLHGLARLDCFLNVFLEAFLL